jgi:hypothetical protein
LYTTDGKRIKSLDVADSSSAFNVIVEPGQYYLKVIYSDYCDRRQRFSVETATDTQERVVSSKLWTSPPDEFLRFDVPGSSLVNLGAFTVFVDTKVGEGFNAGVTCRFTLRREEGDVGEKFRVRHQEIYAHFGGKIVTVK